MKKEIKITEYCNYLSAYDNHTPEELIVIANRMKEDDVSSCRIVDSYGSIDVEYYRLETEEEAFKRVNKEAIEKENRTRLRTEYLINEAKALGYKIEKEQNDQV